ncbi:MAG TPA: MSMEG_6728 family protein [Acidimicrobiales bacterium]|jgi:hypothetical protein|nr:MSMEG_6728 family protein [Acidimicrobiales bacterium]
MQTFLPYPDFAASAAVLDDRRLGKQRVEALQVLRALTIPGYGWRHHPAVAMWRGYEEALGAYGVAICREWCRRGRADTCDTKIRLELAGLGIADVRDQTELDEAGRLPPWLGDEDFHRSHRSSLLSKDTATYGPVFTDVPPDLPYVWPTKRLPSPEAAIDAPAPESSRHVREVPPG